MKKSQRLISIDHHLNERLQQEPNASALINQLVEKHYQNKDNPFLGLSREQLARERKILEIEQEAEKRISEVRNATQ